MNAGTKANATTSAAMAIDPGVRIGHVHLKVANLERSLAFYVGVLGFAITQRYGSRAAFISAGGYHHHIGLNTWESRDGRSSAGRFDRALPCRHTVSDAPCAGGCAAPSRRRWRRARRRERSWRGGSDLFARSRSQRRRALLGSPRGTMAARSGRRARHDNGAAGSRGFARGVTRALTYSRRAPR